MTIDSKFELLGLDIQELTGIAAENGQPPYRARQLSEAIYRQRVAELEADLDLPAEFRGQLAETGFQIGLPSIQKTFVNPAMAQSAI